MIKIKIEKRRDVYSVLSMYDVSLQELEIRGYINMSTHIYTHKHTLTAI